jgi:hypothetical protein
MPMSWIETTLTQLEGNLRNLIEGEAGRDGIPRKLHRQLERRLIQAMKASVSRRIDQVDPHGWSQTAPDQYVLMLPRAQAELVLTHPTELDWLTRKLEDIAHKEGFVFAKSPLLRVVANPQEVDLKIFTEFSQIGLGDSHTSRLGEMLGRFAHGSDGTVPLAFIIVNGLTTFPITEPVINIGRDPSNQLQLEDLRVSRLHAQVRFIQGRFVIFDLDSKGGTFVNGVPVTSQALKAGDVILLAGVPLVYGQETSYQGDYTQELPADPPAPEVL